MDSQGECHSRESGNPGCGVGFLDARLRGHDGKTIPQNSID